MSQFTQNDTAPPLSGSCLNGTAPADLTAASAVVHLEKPDGTVLSRAADVTDPSSGSWSMAWVAGDLASVGHYIGEVEVTFEGGDVQTFGPFGFDVRAELA